MGALVGDTVGDVVGGRVVVGAVVGITVGDNVAPACGMPTPTATAIAAAAASVRRLTARGRPKGTAIATAILAAIGRGALASQRLPTRSRTARACTRVQWWSGGGVASSGALPHTHTCSPAPNESTHWGTQSSIWEIAIFSRQKVVAKLSVAEIDCVTVTCADSEVKKQRTRRRPSHMQGPAAGRPLLARLPSHATTATSLAAALGASSDAAALALVLGLLAPTRAVAVALLQEVDEASGGGGRCSASPQRLGRSVRERSTRSAATRDEPGAALGSAREPQQGFQRNRG